MKKIVIISNPINQVVDSTNDLRGNGWFGDARSARAACRNASLPGLRYGYISFRVVKGNKS